jgi:ribosomal protein S18 acetylase RimI-like enzyme
VIGDAATALLDLTPRDLRPVWWREALGRLADADAEEPDRPRGWPVVSYEIALATGDGAGILLADPGRIHQLAVAPERRREGIGTALLAEALRRIGSAPVALSVRADNRPALALYRGFGFVEIGQRGPLLELERPSAP